MRTSTINERVETEFGAMHICITHEDGRITGGRIFAKRKLEGTQINDLVDALSDGLDQAIKAVR